VLLREGINKGILNDFALTHLLRVDEVEKGKKKLVEHG